MKYRDDDNPIKNFLYETPVASMFLKIVELFTVSMGVSFVLTFIVGSGLAKIIYYRPREVTYTVLFISVFGLFGLGAIFLNGFRGFCRNVKEYFIIMLSAYSVYFIVSYIGLGLKNLPIDDNLLRRLPDWLYHGWSTQAFENVFLPLRIFAYYHWLPDWLAQLAVHILYILMITIIAYKGGEGSLFNIKLFTVKKEFDSESAYPKTARARARYEKRRKELMRKHPTMITDADVDYNHEEYNEYLKTAFDGKDEEVAYSAPDELELENPNYEEEFDEYMKDAFDVDFDEEAPQEVENMEAYNEEFDEYMKAAFDQPEDEIPDGEETMAFDDVFEYAEYQDYEKEFDEYMKDAFENEN